MTEKCPHHDALEKALEKLTDKTIEGDSKAATVESDIKHLIASNISLAESVKELTKAVNTMMVTAVNREYCDKQRDFLNTSLGKLYKHSDSRDADVEREVRDYVCTKLNAANKRIDEIRDGAFKTASIVTAVLFGILSFIQWLITTMN